MNLKFTGPVIDITKDKRGTTYLIVEENGTPQKVKCYGRDIADVARTVRKGAIVAVEATQGARPWTPPDGSPVVWFDGLQATFIEVQGEQPKGNPQPSANDIGDDDVPF